MWNQVESSHNLRFHWFGSQPDWGTFCIFTQLCGFILTFCRFDWVLGLKHDGTIHDNLQDVMTQTLSSSGFCFTLKEKLVSAGLLTHSELNQSLKFELKLKFWGTKQTTAWPACYHQQMFSFVSNCYFSFSSVLILWGHDERTPNFTRMFLASYQKKWLPINMGWTEAVWESELDWTVINCIDFSFDWTLRLKPENLMIWGLLFTGFCPECIYYFSFIKK